MVNVTIYIAYMDPMGWIVYCPLVLLRQIYCPTTSLRPHPEWMVYGKTVTVPIAGRRIQIGGLFSVMS